MRAYDVIRMLSRDGRPTPLGDAIAHYGRIAKTLHILRLADEPGYRRQIKSQANLQEGRHSLARKIFHARSGQRYQRCLSPFVRHHVNMLGRYSFQLPDLPGGLRPLSGGAHSEISGRCRPSGLPGRRCAGGLRVLFLSGRGGPAGE
ncbi:hypothetical protein DV517_42620 [Streptomyces sp. S816]|nr:hypothetical protein DV517_42620 [Streptomyces sp. S816]